MKDYGVLTSKGRYTKFSFMNYTITFLTSKDLIAYVDVKSIDNGVLTVLCKGKVKRVWRLYWSFIYFDEFEDEPRCLFKGFEGG